MATWDQTLPGHIQERLKSIIETSGHPVVVEDVEVLEFDSEVKYGTSASPFHCIRISKSYEEHREHFILSSLVKIQRFLAAPLAQRYLPVIDVNGRLPPEEEGELAARVPEAPREVLWRMSNYLHVGLVRQLLSFPLDLRVEKELANVTKHRSRQLAYLRRQISDLEEHFDARIEAFSPPQTYAATSAMNVALAEFCAKRTGDRVGGRVRHSRHRERGKHLLVLLDGVSEPGHIGDRRAQDLWGSELGLRCTYSWQTAEG